MTFWMNMLSLGLLVISPILAWVCDNKVWCWVTLIIGEILAAIYAFPIVISDLLSK